MTPETALVGNGASTREAVPTEEAARIIAAVLSHVTHQRGEVGGVLEENRSRIPAIEPKDSSPKPEMPRTSEEKPAVAKVVETAAGGNADPAKPRRGGQAGAGEPSSGSNPVDFVRRWFVGRSQG
ncbi:MAG: hypothetical protein WDN28_25330 [Chthoniobacter sp.]